MSLLTRATAFVAAILILATASAFAQDREEPTEEVRLGSRIPWRIERPNASQREAIRVLFRFGRCTVEAKPEDSALLLRSPSTAPEQEAIVMRLGGRNNRCLTADRMQLDIVPFRGAIANALYLRDYPAFPSDRLPAAPETAGEMLSGDPRTMFPGFARCVVRTNPAAVDAMLRTRPASDEEHERLAGMVGDFSSCLFQGQNLQANGLFLRSILAEAAYSLSQGASPATGRQGPE